MKRYIIIICCITILILVSCIENSIVKIKAEFKGEEDILINTPKDIEEFYLFTLQHKLIKLTGIEKLRNLRRLKIIGLTGFTNYSFLTKLFKLNELFMQGAELHNYNFLKYLKGLKIFYVDSVHLDNFILNFKYNIELESVVLNNLHNINRKPFTISIKNIPESLKYLDLHLNTELIFTSELLQSIKSVDYIFVPNEIKDEFQDFFENNKNFIFEMPNKIRPEKYNYKALSKRTEYGLDYF